MTYVFILCPQYCGSSLLWKLISTSNAVSSFPGEGQFLPEVKDAMRKAPWDADLELSWPTIKTVWDGYWNHSKPYLLEKSPPNLIRTDAIAAHFDPARYVIMVRNPYAHCEGMIRRNGKPAAEAAAHAIRCLRKQAQNAHELFEVKLAFTYEELTADPADICRKIEGFLPGLGALDHDRKFELREVDGMGNRPITDMNDRNIAGLTPEHLKEINAVFKPNEDALRRWGYEVMP